MLSQCAINELLAILQAKGFIFPKDVRTLLRTPKTSSFEIVHIKEGQYYHLGIANELKTLLKN
jgi:hypothetical protein